MVYLVVLLLFVWANVHRERRAATCRVALRAVLLASQPVEALARALCGGRRVALRLAVRLFARGYYHHLLADPILHSFINEWGPSTPSAKTAAFYALAAATSLADRPPRKAGHALRAVGAPLTLC